MESALLGARLVMGRRVYLLPDDYHLLRPGEYMRGQHHWWGRIPRCSAFPDGALANLKDYDVTEHSDGTITVSPSIEIDGGMHAAGWRGCLERGVWRS